MTLSGTTKIEDIRTCHACNGGSVGPISPDANAQEQARCPSCGAPLSVRAFPTLALTGGGLLTLLGVGFAPMVLVFAPELDLGQWSMALIGLLLMGGGSGALMWGGWQLADIQQPLPANPAAPHPPMPASRLPAPQEDGGPA